jgi:CrcB protein
MASAGREARRATIVLVGAGGALGAVFRYWIDLWVPGWPPLGTLAANVLGAFVLGVVLSEGRLAARLTSETRLLVGTGFCGSLTTYSTFAAETASATPARAAGYVVATYALGLGAVLAGRLVARWGS